jgi:hypothetical protein
MDAQGDAERGFTASWSRPCSSWILAAGVDARHVGEAMRDALGMAVIAIITLSIGLWQWRHQDQIVQRSDLDAAVARPQRLRRTEQHVPDPVRVAVVPHSDRNLESRPRRMDHRRHGVGERCDPLPLGRTRPNAVAPIVVPPRLDGVRRIGIDHPRAASVGKLASGGRRLHRPFVGETTEPDLLVRC